MKTNNIQVLIPTYNKTIDEIKSLCSFWNLQSDALISVQSDSEYVTSFRYCDFDITVIFNKTKGVSRNRNILLSNINSEIGIFIDDDCSMVNGYVTTICSFFEKNNCDCACFNGFLPNKESVLIHNSRSKRVKTFYDVSSVGAPGFAFSKKFLCNKTISFDESLGTPNFIVLGEDSKFVKDVCKISSRFYRSNDPVFKIENDLDNSSYFQSFADGRFLISKGFVVRKIFPKSWMIHNLFYAYKLSKRTELSIRQILFYFGIGSKLNSDKKRRIVKLVNSNTCYEIRLDRKINHDHFCKMIEDYYINKDLSSIYRFLNDNSINFNVKNRRF